MTMRNIIFTLTLLSLVGCAVPRGMLPAGTGRLPPPPPVGSPAAEHLVQNQNGQGPGSLVVHTALPFRAFNGIRVHTLGGAKLPGGKRIPRNAKFYFHKEGDFLPVARAIGVTESYVDLDGDGHPDDVLEHLTYRDWGMVASGIDDPVQVLVAIPNGKDVMVEGAVWGVSGVPVHTVVAHFECAKPRAGLREMTLAQCKGPRRP